MSLALRVLAALFICLSVVPLAHAQQRAEEVRFTHAGVQADAKRYETYLKANWQPRASGAELRAEGDRLLAAGTDSARRIARLRAGRRVRRQRRGRPGPDLPARCSPSSPTRAAERYDLPVNASGAAWNAYERAQDAGRQGGCAGVLHDALKRRSYWRPAIDALKSSLSPRRRRRRCARPTTRWWPSTASASPSTRSMPTAAQPRLCIQFSERLAPGQVDWAQYFKVDGKDPQAVTAEARQICLDGLAHGKRYEVQVRAGLPSAIASETLAKTAELAVYVKDRSPVRARHGPRLRAAQPRPAGHPARHRQHRQGQGRGLPHRRPQPRADAAERRLRRSRSPPTTSAR